MRNAPPRSTLGGDPEEPASAGLLRPVQVRRRGRTPPAAEGHGHGAHRVRLLEDREYAGGPLPAPRCTRRSLGRQQCSQVARDGTPPEAKTGSAPVKDRMPPVGDVLHGDSVID